MGIGNPPLVTGPCAIPESGSLIARGSCAKEDEAMAAEATGFEPIRYKETTPEQWQTAAEPWYRWGPTLEQWLGQATQTMLDMAGVGPGSRVLDVAAGAGGQS